jgi:thiamine biosynthesis lipoprotein
MSGDLIRHTPTGPTIGTRGSALCVAPPGFDPAPVQAALRMAMNAVDVQISSWKPASDGMRLNAAPVGDWPDIPPDLAHVPAQGLALGLAIGRASGGSFGVYRGDAVRSSGFGPGDADPNAIRAAMQPPRHPALRVLDLDGDRVRKTAALTLDLTRIGGKVRATGLRPCGRRCGRPCGRPCGRRWSIVVKTPDDVRPAPPSILTLQGAAVAPSGDYRHWVTVFAPTCAAVDAWATAPMVSRADCGAGLAQQTGLDAVFPSRDSAGDVHRRGVTRPFSPKPAAMAPAIGG